MSDTTPEIQDIMDDIYKSKSGEEKLLIALSMFETARKIVLSSIPLNLSDKNVRIELFLRFYGNDFNEKEKDKIISIL